MLTMQRLRLRLRLMLTIQRFRLTMQRLSPVLGKYHGQSVSLSLSTAKSSERQNAPKTKSSETQDRRRTMATPHLDVGSLLVMRANHV